MDVIDSQAIKRKSGENDFPKIFPQKWARMPRKHRHGRAWGLFGLKNRRKIALFAKNRTWFLWMLLIVRRLSENSWNVIFPKIGIKEKPSTYLTTGRGKNNKLIWNLMIKLNKEEIQMPWTFKVFISALRKKEWNVSKKGSYFIKKKKPSGRRHGEPRGKNNKLIWNIDD